VDVLEVAEASVRHWNDVVELDQLARTTPGAAPVERFSDCELRVREGTSGCTRRHVDAIVNVARVSLGDCANPPPPMVVSKERDARNEVRRPNADELAAPARAQVLVPILRDPRANALVVAETRPDMVACDEPRQAEASVERLDDDALATAAGTHGGECLLLAQPLGESSRTSRRQASTVP